MKKRRTHILRRLAGHLITETDEQRRNFDLLYKALADADLPDDDRLSIGSDFSIEKADLFFDETIPKQRVAELDTLARRLEDREDAREALEILARNETARSSDEVRKRLGLER